MKAPIDETHAAARALAHAAEEEGYKVFRVTLAGQEEQVLYDVHCTRHKISGTPAESMVVNESDKLGRPVEE